jgi:hypothetical protein
MIASTAASERPAPESPDPPTITGVVAADGAVVVLGDVGAGVVGAGAAGTGGVGAVGMEGLSSLVWPGEEGRAGEGDGIAGAVTGVRVAGAGGADGIAGVGVAEAPDGDVSAGEDGESILFGGMGGTGDEQDTKASREAIPAMRTRDNRYIRTFRLRNAHRNCRLQMKDQAK